MGRAPQRLPLSSFLPEWTAVARDIGATGRWPSHVALAACRPHERAREQRIDGRTRGVFSHALLGALQTLSPGATYRDLLSTARCTVQDLTSESSRRWSRPRWGSPTSFLGGRISRPAIFRLRCGPSGLGG